MTVQAASGPWITASAVSIEQSGSAVPSAQIRINVVITMSNSKSRALRAACRGDAVMRLVQAWR